MSVWTARAHAPRRSGDRRAAAPALAGLRLATAALALAVVYTALYQLIVLETSFGSSVGAAFWPAAGVTVAVLVLRPQAEWPVYVAVIWLTETILDVRADFGVPVSVAMGAANAAEPLVAALLLARWLPGRAPDLSRLRDLGVFLLAAACIGPGVGALIGSGIPWLLDIDPLWPRIARWYLGDALGVVVIAPFIISVARPPAQSLLDLGEAWTLAVLAATAGLALGPWEFSAQLGLPFLVIPALALVGMRMGTRAAAGGVLGVAMLVETTTALGSGPFADAGSGVGAGVLVAQMYLATCALSALTVAALMTGLVSGDKLALHDSLTGLANRRLVYDRLDVACRHLARTPGHVGVLFVDLDGFKAVNDRHGHSAGDHVLVDIARRLRRVVRDQDTVARLGGDEFIVLVDRDADPAMLEGLARRAAAAVAEPIDIGAATVRVTASVGVAVTRQADEDPEALVNRADRAMYAVKHGHERPARRLR